MAINREKLRKELISALSAYAKDPADADMKKAARRLHQEYGDSHRLVDRYMSLAIRLLPNIGWEAIEPKPSSKDAERLVFALATRKA
ncbi:MAG: hypothetical protein J7K54_05355 [Candidatus Aenigmarchaeota archaeon]|nr:hypothetical protein [Candidatus Aenigmarchaeota archaeon]